MSDAMPELDRPVEDAEEVVPVQDDEEMPPELELVADEAQLKDQAAQVRTKFGVEKVVVVKVQRNRVAEAAARARRYKLYELRKNQRMAKLLATNVPKSQRIAALLKVPQNQRLAALLKANAPDDDQTMTEQRNPERQVANTVVKPSTRPVGYECPECGAKYSNHRTLWRHKKQGAKACERHRRRMERGGENLLKQFGPDHQIRFESLRFESEAQFHEWKARLEKEAGARFVKGSGDRKRKNGHTYAFYLCSRCPKRLAEVRKFKNKEPSTSTSEGTVVVKKQKSEEPATTTIDRCPAFMNTILIPNKEQKDKNEVRVKFCNEHSDHGRDLPVEKKRFSTFGQFNDWKLALEKAAGIRFIKRRFMSHKEPRKDGASYGRYCCNGTLRSRLQTGADGRKYWSKPTRPSEVLCPAFFSASVFPNDEVFVRYYLTHEGHPLPGTDEPTVPPTPLIQAASSDVERDYVNEQSSAAVVSNLSGFRDDPATVSLYQSPQRPPLMHPTPAASVSLSSTGSSSKSQKRKWTNRVPHTSVSGGADDRRSRLEKLEMLIASARSKDGNGPEHVWRAIDSAIDNASEMLRTIRPSRPPTNVKKQGPRILLPNTGVTATPQAAQRPQPRTQPYSQHVIQVDDSEWVQVAVTTTDWTGGNLVTSTNYTNPSAYYYMQ